MKYHKNASQHLAAASTLIATILLALGGAAAGADTKDQMIGKIVGQDKATSAPPYAIAAHALVGKDNSIAVSAWSGRLVFEGATFDAFQTTLVIADATAARTVTVPDATGTLELIKVHAHAATATIAANELYGGVLTNTGASGAVVYSLPAPAVGMHFRVYLTVAQDVNVNPANGTRILVLTNAAGDAISSEATIGNSIELVAVSDTLWVAFASSGTWSDVD